MCLFKMEMVCFSGSTPLLTPCIACSSSSVMQCFLASFFQSEEGLEERGGGRFMHSNIPCKSQIEDSFHRKCQRAPG